MDNRWGKKSDARQLNRPRPEEQYTGARNSDNT